MYKLLIADDEALEREALGYFVKNAELDIEEIIECSNGNEVVRQVMLNKPDIIILDINMPGLNGLEAFEQIRNVGHPCRVIFSTAFDYFEYAVKALQLGAMDFLVKPLKKERLIGGLIKAMDQLDAEAEISFRQQKLMNMLDVFGEKILKKLVAGEMDEEVFYYLEVLDIPFDTPGQCLCVRTVGETGTEERTALIKNIKDELSYLGIKPLINWYNEMMTIVNFFASECSGNISFMAEERIKNLLQRNKVNFIFGGGTLFEDLSQAEQSYGTARECVGSISVSHESAANDKKLDISETIRKIKEYVELHYDKHLTLDAIAYEAGYSKFYINRLFKQQMNTTIMDYLIQIRIGRAKELLKKEGYTVKQISGMVGYSEPNYFTLTFKKSEGVSPVQYRYQAKEEA